MLFMGPAFGGHWVGSTAACLASGRGGVTVTAVASLTITGVIPVSGIDPGEHSHLDAGWLEAFCSLSLTSGMGTRIWMKLLNCGVWDEVLFPKMMSRAMLGHSSRFISSLGLLLPWKRLGLQL